MKYLKLDVKGACHLLYHYETLHLATRWLCTSPVILTANSSFFPEQRQRAGLCNGGCLSDTQREIFYLSTLLISNVLWNQWEMN